MTVCVRCGGSGVYTTMESGSCSACGGQGMRYGNPHEPGNPCMACGGSGSTQQAVTRQCFCSGGSNQVVRRGGGGGPKTNAEVEANLAGLIFVGVMAGLFLLTFMHWAWPMGWALATSFGISFTLMVMLLRGPLKPVMRVVRVVTQVSIKLIGLLIAAAVIGGVLYLLSQGSP